MGEVPLDGPSAFRPSFWSPALRQLCTWRPPAVSPEPHGAGVSPAPSTLLPAAGAQPRLSSDWVSRGPLPAGGHLHREPGPHLPPGPGLALLPDVTGAFSLGNVLQVQQPVERLAGPGQLWTEGAREPRGNELRRGSGGASAPRSAGRPCWLLRPPGVRRRAAVGTRAGRRSEGGCSLVSALTRPGDLVTDGPVFCPRSAAWNPSRHQLWAHLCPAIGRGGPSWVAEGRVDGRQPTGSGRRDLGRCLGQRAESAE